MSPRPRGWVRRLVDNVEERGDEEEEKEPYSGWENN